MNQVSTWKPRLELLATVLVLLVTLMVGAFALVDRLDRSQPESPQGLGAQPVKTSVPISLADALVKGNKSAKVALVLFSDFECPVCARAAKDVLPQLEARYITTGKVLLVWRHFPLPIHSSARGAAEAADCAGRQGKFWELHDWAFTHQQELQPDRLADFAERQGLNMPSFKSCVAGEAAERVKTDIALGKQLGVSGTPTWFIGTIEPDGTVKPIDRIVGLGPVAAYKKAIDKIVQSR